MEQEYKERLTFKPFETLQAMIDEHVKSEQDRPRVISAKSYEKIYFIAGQVVLKCEFEAMRDGLHERIDFRRY